MVDRSRVGIAEHRLSESSGDSRWLAAMAPIRLVVIGAGGHGAELLSYIDSLDQSELEPGRRAVALVGFIDESRPAGPFGSSRVVGPLGALERLLDGPDPPTHYVTAVGDNVVREGLVGRIEELSAGRLQPWTLRHPTATMTDTAIVGAGSLIAPGAVLTTRLTIGRHTIVNVKASVSHDCAIGDFVNLNPSATICGNVRIGRGCFIGAGATVVNNVSIGDQTIVGAGAVVLDDLPAGVTAVGVPARVIRR